VTASNDPGGGLVVTLELPTGSLEGSGGVPGVRYSSR
jgi:hypothetical protein